MRNRILILLLLSNLAILPKSFSQNVSINATGNLPDSSAMLDVSSTSRGFLMPRMSTAQRNSITSPAKGLAIFNSTNNGFEVNTGTSASPVWTTLITTASITDTTSIANYYLKVRSELSGGPGITYNNITGIITNAGVVSVNGNIGALIIDTGYTANFSTKVRSVFSSTSPVTYTNGLIGMSVANSSANGYLSSTDWNTFNNKASIANSWSTTGNLGTNSGSNFIGTSNNRSLSFATNNARRMYIDSATGYVGFGTTIPSQKIDVTGNLKLSGAFMPGGSAGSSGYFLESMGSGASPQWVDGSSYNWQLGGNAVDDIRALGTITAIDLPIITNGREKMRVANTGSVGIGSSTFNEKTPERLLVDAGDTPESGENVYQNIIVGKGNTNNYAQLNIQNSNSGAAASSDVVATADNGDETVNYIDMGINGSGANYDKQILGGLNTAYLYSSGNDFAIGNATPEKNLLFFTGGTGANERMRIDGGGNIGIGTTSPAYKLTVEGIVAPSSDNSYSLGGSTSNRWSVVYATNGTIQTSDRRLKTNIKNLNYGLKEILAMQPISYNWKEKPTTNNKIGLIAQDVKKLVPEVVTGDEAKEKLGMNYGELVPVLVNAIKEQQSEIESLKKDIQFLKDKYKL